MPKSLVGPMDNSLHSFLLPSAEAAGGSGKQYRHFLAKALHAQAKEFGTFPMFPFMAVPFHRSDKEKVGCGARKDGRTSQGRGNR